MKEMRRKLLRILLMVAMVIGLLPGMGLTALAWDGNPYATLLNTIVNFDGKEWYLIEDKSTAANAGTVTLLAKECVAVSKFGSNNTYSGSTVETAVKNYYTNSISDNVKSAIVDSKMFFLTTDQASTIEQENQEVLKCNWASEAEYNAWWLCSPGESYEVQTAAYVNGEYGYVDDDGSEMDDVLGVRPALQLDLSRVTFDDGERTFTVVEAAHTHDDVTFTPWTAADGMPTMAGNYYLANDVTIDSTWNVPTGTTNLCLNGHTITGNVLNEVITIGEGNTLNLYDCSSDATGTITNGNIGVCVDEGGKFNMYGGKISGNTTMYNGGGVYNKGTFTMKGGKISGNTTMYHGGGVYNKGTFTMDGGEISSNTTMYNGGGVYNKGTFTMKGGKISGNTTMYNGGGVYNKGTFTMDGGEISSNTANLNSGGGVCNEGTFTMSGGTISSNTAEHYAGGVNHFGETINLSGNPIIANNTNNNVSILKNVYLNENKFVTVVGDLSESASIGITMAKPGTFTTGSIEQCKASDYQSRFFSDDTSYKVLTAGNELKLGTHEHSFTYTLSEDGKIIIATCTAEGCDLPVVDGKHVATLTIGSPAHTTYGDGNSAEATITDQYSIKGDAQVVYYNATKNGDAYIKTGDALGEAPTIPGDYVAEITLGTGDNTATASVGYTIAKADLTASVTQEGTLTYTGEPQTPTVATSASGKGSQTVTFTYSKTEDGPFGEMPSITNVSESGTFYYKATAPNHNDALGSFTVSMNKKAGSISYGTGAVTKTYGDAKFTNTLTNTGDGTVKYTSSDPAVATVNDSTGEVTIVKAGKTSITATVTDGANYTYATNTASYTLTVNKATNPASVTETAAVTKGGNTIDLADKVTLNGATGEVSYAITGEDKKGCSLSGSVLTSGNESGSVTVNISIAADDKYQAVEKTITVNITDKQTQTITAADVTATYGDTGVKVSATTDGGGTITYAVKKGSEEYIGITIDTGALSLIKAGTGTVVVTASETATYAKATKEVTVTINKAAPTVATVTANSLIYDGTPKPLVTVKDETLGGEMKYALGTQSGATGEYSKNIPTGTGAGTYYVWYKVFGDENHNDTEPKCVTATISYNVYNVVTDNQEWTKGSSNTLTITFKATNDDGNTYTKWKQKVYVDGTEIGTANYTAKSGSLVIDLKPAYLEKLSEGKHKLSVGFNDIEGLVTANFTVKAKSSGGGSSTPKKKTDNVVTCQMAGYPANYAWNEAAKACQPGYIDANGVFRSTSKTSNVPNTYDKGVGGNVVSLLIATIFGIGAAHMLRKYR